jgi:hypothetical protein
LLGGVRVRINQTGYGQLARSGQGRPRRKSLAQFWRRTDGRDPLTLNRNRSVFDHRQVGQENRAVIDQKITILRCNGLMIHFMLQITSPLVRQSA